MATVFKVYYCLVLLLLFLLIIIYYYCGNKLSSFKSLLRKEVELEKLSYSSLQSFLKGSSLSKYFVDTKYC